MREQIFKLILFIDLIPQDQIKSMHSLSQVFILSAPHCLLDLCFKSSGIKLLQQEDSISALNMTTENRFPSYAFHRNRLFVISRPQENLLSDVVPGLLAPTQSDPESNLAVLSKSGWLGLCQPRFIWSLLWIPKLDPNKKIVNCFPSMCCLQAQPTSQGTWYCRLGNICRMPHDPWCKLICKGDLTV